MHTSRDRRDNDRGFTLVELLVVVVIIGVLSAIAVPVFTNQRRKAVDASIKTDIHSMSIAVETYMAAHPDVTDGPGTESTHIWNYDPATKALTGNFVTFDDGSTVTVSKGTYIETYGYNDNALNTTKRQGYCISAANADSSRGWHQRTASNGQPKGSDMWWYDSATGGITDTPPGWC